MYWSTWGRISGRILKTMQPRIKNEPRYSGPKNSGICICGHSWEDHHLGIVMNEDYFNDTGEYYFPEECEVYGFNKTGGLDSEGNDHCGRYNDIGNVICPECGNEKPNHKMS